MDSTLGQHLKEVVGRYAGGGINLKTVPLFNDEQQTYGVIMVDSPIRQQKAGILVLACVIDDQIIIEEDNTDHPLFEVLMRQGIPREKIILRYAGESHRPT